MGNYFRIAFVLVVVTVVMWRAEGHGKMLDPPGRNTVFNTQRNNAANWTSCVGSSSNINYSDKGQNCGGRGVQEANEGLCSACGDNYVSPYPRPHDYNGRYVSNMQPTRAYLAGEKITALVYISAQHKGGFEFRLCTLNEMSEVSNGNNDALTKCFNNKGQGFHQLLTGTNGQKVYTGPAGFTSISKTGNYRVPVQLPAGVTCTKGCSFQWWWRAGNNPGPVQEHFVNCADIVIGTCEDYRNGNIDIDNVCGYGISQGVTDCLAGNNNQQGGSSGSSQGTSGSNGSPQGTQGSNDNNNVNNNAGIYGEQSNTGSSGCNCDCSQSNPGTSYTEQQQQQNGGQSNSNYDSYEQPGWDGGEQSNSNYDLYGQSNGYDGDQSNNNYDSDGQYDGYDGNQNNQQTNNQGSNDQNSLPGPDAVADRCASGLYWSMTDLFEDWCGRNCILNFCPTSHCCGNSKARSLKTILTRVVDLEKTLEQRKRDGGYGK